MTIADDVRNSYLEAEANSIEAEAELVRAYREYYGGTHPTYLSDRQKEFLSLALDYDFRVNYCAPVVDIAGERLNVLGFDGGQEDAGQKLAAAAWRWWKLNDTDQGQDDLFVSALRDGAAYLVVDWDEAQGRPRWTVNYAFDGTRGCRVNYHPDSGAVLSVTKFWHEYDPDTPGATGTPRKTVYFPGYIERWRAGKDGWELVELVDWLDDAGQPLGLAVIPFDNPGGSELREAVPIQDMINKTALDLVAAADTMGFGILYASGVDAAIDPATGEEVELVIGPGRILRLTSPQASLGRVEPDDLNNLIDAVTFWVVQIASVTRTPQYLFQRWGAEPPSGESLKAQETGLVSKCGRKQVVFGNSFEQVIRLSARLQNLYGGERLDPEALIETVWQSAATRDEAALLQTLESKQRLGVPPAQLWAEMGYDQDKIAEFRRQREASRDQAMGTMVRQIITAQQNEEEAEGGAETGS